MAEVQLVGASPREQEVFQLYLDNPQGDCFGKRFAKSAAECQACLLPVIVEGRITFMRDLCEARTKGAASPTQLVRLTTRDVIRRLDQGQSPQTIFNEILGDSDPSTGAQAARALLASRLGRMRFLGLPTPKLPPLAELRRK